MPNPTPNRGYRYALSTDGPQIYQWFQDLAEDVDTDIAAIVAAFLTPARDSSAGHAETGFTDSGSYVDTALDGHLVMAKILVTPGSTITTSSGDLTDVLAYTLDAPYCPNDTVNGVLGNGHTTGEATLGADGKVMIRSASNDIAGSSLIRMLFVYCVI